MTRNILKIGCSSIDGYVSVVVNYAMGSHHRKHLGQGQKGKT